VPQLTYNHPSVTAPSRAVGTRQARAVMMTGLSSPFSIGGHVPAVPSCILEPLSDQFAAVRSPRDKPEGEQSLHAAHSGLGGRPARRRSGVAAHPERGQHLAGRVAGSPTDCGQGPRAGQHRGQHRSQHRPQRMLSASPVAWGRRAARGSQAGHGTGRVPAQRARPADEQQEQGIMKRLARQSGLVMGFDTT
jgi:hypothetical protein